jgi:hypothetical protein
MEIDSSCYDSSKYVEFPKINTNTNTTLKSNSFLYNSDYSNKITPSKICHKKSDIKSKPIRSINNKSKERLNLLISQKIANNKINYMNFYKISSEIMNYKNNYITKEDPINQYINYFTPFEKNCEHLPSEFLSSNKQFLHDIKKINIKKKKKENEKYITFKKEKSKKYNNHYYSRMYNVEYNNKTITYEEKIILIQKCIRGFIMRKKINKEISRLTINYIINSIIRIQRAIRIFLAKKNYYKKQIIKIIINERKEKANKIVDMLSMYHLRNEYKKILLIRKIMVSRLKSANKICKAIKYYLIRKKIKKIKNLQKNNLEIIYPINKKKNIQLKIYVNENIYKVIDFEFCELRKIHVLYINYDSLDYNKNKNEFLCHFIVDNECVIDKRYKIVKSKYGILYNAIEYKKKETKKNLNEKDYITNKKKHLNKYEKIKTNSIPFKYDPDLLSDLKSCDYNNSSKSNQSCTINDNDIYVNDYIKDYNDTYSNVNLGYRNTNFNKYYLNQDGSDNYLGNSSSTISNSNNYNKHDYTNKKYLESEIITEEKSGTYKNNKKKKKIFPIFY